MWFLFGFFSVFTAIAFSIQYRLAAKWKGIRHSTAHDSYELGVDLHKGKITRIRVGVTCTTGFNFRIRKENYVDKFFKFVGLSVEQQFENLSFDEQVYVISDDYRLSEGVKNKLAVQGYILTIFAGNLLPNFTAKEIRCQQNRLWIVATPRHSVDNDDCRFFGTKATPMLREISTALQTTAPNSTGTQDRFIFKAAILLGTSTALAINSCIQGFRLGLEHFPIVLNNTELLRQALVPALIMAALLLSTCVYLLGRTSRAHVVFLELLFIGTVGAFGTAYFELRDYNIDFDTNAPKRIHTAVIEKYTTRCGKRKRRTCYHVQLAGWPDHAQGIKLQISQGLYDGFKAGGGAEITMHDGELGGRWIEEPKPSEW